MMSCLCLFADYSALDRVDPSMLSEQQRMELLFTPDNYEEARKLLKGDESDACTWEGVYCDDFRHIGTISWHIDRVHLEGHINFQMLSPMLTLFNLYKQRLSGDIDVSALPRTLKVFCAQDCYFTGTLDLCSLPWGLTQFIFSGNDLHSLSAIKNLPDTLRTLRVTESTVAEKSVHVGKLPDSKLVVDLKGCGITEVTLENEADRRRVQFLQDHAHRGR